MENEKDETLDSTNEAEESSTSEEEQNEEIFTEEDGSDEQNDSDESSDDVELLKQKNKQLFERAKKAEEKLKERKASESKGQKLTEPKSKSTISEDEILDKASLMNQGYSREELKKLDKIRKLEKLEGNEISLIDAAKTDYFVAWREKIKQEEKDKKAQLGASRKGSVSSLKKKPLSRDQHIEATKKWKFVD